MLLHMHDGALTPGCRAGAHCASAQSQGNLATLAKSMNDHNLAHICTFDDERSRSKGALSELRAQFSVTTGFTLLKRGEHGHEGNHDRCSTFEIASPGAGPYPCGWLSENYPRAPSGCSLTHRWCIKFILYAALSVSLATHPSELHGVEHRPAANCLNWLLLQKQQCRHLMSPSATVIHTVGSKVWVRDDAESWVKAEVQKIERDVLIVALEEGGELRKVNPEDAPLQNVDSRGVEVWQLQQQHCSTLLIATPNHPLLALTAGYDTPVIPPRTWGPLEHQMQIHVR